MNDLVSPTGALLALWVLWMLSWLIAKRWTATTVAQESSGDRLRYGVFLWAGGALLFFHTGNGPLVRPLFPAPDWLGWTGVALAALGFGITWWARVHLGRLWSSNITLKEGHTIVRTGPYALTRHPIYSGLLLALTATAIVRAVVASVLGLVLVTIGFVLKMRQEERLLTRHFGDAYREYSSRVAALIPGVW